MCDSREFEHAVELLSPLVSQGSSFKLDVHS